MVKPKYFIKNHKNKAAASFLEDLSDEVGVDPDTLDVEMGIYPTNGTGEDQNQGNLISPKPGTNSSTQTKGALLLSPGSALGASFWDGGIVHYRFATERRLGKI